MQQCGFCSAVTEVFRRLLCIGGSRRGSGDSCYQELETDEETRRGGISIDRSENGLLIRAVEPSVIFSSKTKRLSHSDWLLLETLEVRCKKPIYSGRFLTMHKRRRKRLITRSLSRDHALLDDIHHGQVKCVLDKISQWPFNAFILDNVTGGRSLPVLCVHLFHSYGLIDHFKLDVIRCWKFFSLIEEGYHSTNPYHNSIHATDVTQAMHCFLQEKKIMENLTPLEIMASLIAAVTHDLDHPGVNQPFLIATSNHLAALYENSSVLENHHWRSAIGCLLESHVAEEIEDCRPELQRQISSLILATDITRQQEFLTRFKRYLDQDLLDMKQEEHRHFILQIALKCADISNPCRPWEVSKKWSQKVCEEFFRQGDYERQLNLPVTALCDRQSTSVPKIQAGFFTFVVYPLFEEWHRFLGEGLSDDMMRNLHGNKIKWDALIQQEKSKEVKTENEEMVSSQVLQQSSTEISVDEVEVKRSKNDNFLKIPEWNHRERIGRRHSVPLSVSGYSQIPSRTFTRRESLPIEERKSESGLLEEVEEESTHTQTFTPLVSNHNKGSGWIEQSDSEPKILSSENLLPDPSIASITTVKEASQLSFVLCRRKDQCHTSTKSQLTRQQTFPPVSPYVRQRYLSTTVEMSECMNIDLSQIDNSSETLASNSEVFRANNISPVCSYKQEFDGLSPLVLRESNKSSCKLDDLDKPNCDVRETENSSQDKGCKYPKFLDEKYSQPLEKENLDPKRLNKVLDSEVIVFHGCGNSRKNVNQGQFGTRRGSAPVASEAINPVALAPRSWSERYPRRGSVPVDAIQSYAGSSGSFYVSQEPGLCLSQQNFSARRDSIPSELNPQEGSKGRSRNKKILCRRSSGGPEMFLFCDKENESVRWKVDIVSKRHGDINLNSRMTRRRGSLPVEVLLATHSGDHRETQGS